MSQIYLTGRGDRSYFDMRTIKYYGYSESDVQSTLPVILPVVDYAYTFDQPVFNGELGYKVNFTSLSRQTVSYDAISLNAVNNNWCAINADPAQKVSSNCLLRGFPGTYTRLSAEATWRSQYIDPLGQVITPFASVRADVAAVSVQSQVGVSNYLTPGDSDVSRMTPTAGVEYRYPFISVEPWGTQTVQPIGQLILRPSETNIGKLPNEDSQSLVFDDTNLFKVDKYAGWDRAEGGGRANAGVEYTTQFNRGGYVDALFGQSYQLFGTNSFAVGDTTNTGLGSGLDKPASDYVARLDLSAEPHLFLHLPVSLRRIRFQPAAFRSRGARELGPLDRNGHVRRLCGAAPARLPLPARRHPRDVGLQVQRELGGKRRRPLRYRRRQVRPDAGGLRLYRRLLHPVAQLLHGLHV